MTLNEVFKDWLPYKKRQVKLSSLAVYESSYRCCIAPKIGDIDVGKISRKVMVDFANSLIDSGLSVRTARDTIVVVKMLMYYASEMLELDVKLPTWKINWPSKNTEDSSDVPRYTPDEFKRITTYALQNPSSKNLSILLTICTGMRIGEICALQYRDIDTDKQMVRITKSISRVRKIYPANGERHTELVIGLPKTTSAKREIPILADIYPMVLKFVEVSRPEYYVCSFDYKPMEPRTFREYYKYFILKKVGLKRSIKFHGLRHTFASTMIENHVDVKTVSTLLGHSDITTTMNFYVHPTAEVKHNAINSGLQRLFQQHI